MKNYVFIGGSGSGKSVAALNLAVQLAGTRQEAVHLYDLDQTKPLFRTRDLDALLEEKGVLLHCERQFYDAPAMRIGLVRQMKDERCVNILDVGGDERGAAMVGQFAAQLNVEETCCLYVINPFRPWSDRDAEIRKTMDAVLAASGIRQCRILANPHLGEETTPELVCEGFERLKETLAGEREIAACCVFRGFAEQVRERLGVELLPLDHFIKMYED